MINQMAAFETLQLFKIQVEVTGNRNLAKDGFRVTDMVFCIDYAR